ncbi:MAG: glycosyltransferase [Chitinivibrionales bacterium]|nr:glycosyltransferase [Chitinivibrionales bacterium]
MVLSIVMPVLNEEKTAEDVIVKLLSTDFPQVELELVIVNDGSTDRSLEIIRELAQTDKRIKVFSHDSPQGKGAALATGFSKTTGDIVIVQDADLEYDCAEISRLVKPILLDRADIVYGSRFKKSVLQVHRTYHAWANRILTALSNIASGIQVSDMETCYKAFRGDIIRNAVLQCRHFGFEPEITAKIAKLHVRIFELPITYYPRNYIEGKKITWRDGVAAMWHIFRFNYLTGINDSFTPDLPKKYLKRRDYDGFHSTSH